MDEFELIRHYFTGRGARRGDVRVGVGDDAAVLAVPPGCELLLTTDSLVAGRHLPTEGFPPAALGHRALAVSLSDVAAMGGTPAWALLALVLPEAEEDWLADFATGFAGLAERYEVALAGGNVARGPLAVTVTVAGFVRAGEALRRRGARAGDALFVTGALGGGVAGLRALAAGASADAPEAAAYARPEPRLRAGRALAPLAHAAIDVSDGLVGDLAKLLAASGGLGAELESAALPLASGATLEDALGPSDDYELLGAVPESADVAGLAGADCALTRIGRVASEPGVRMDGVPLRSFDGYRHFV